MTTRPPSNDPADVAVWEAERRAKENRLRDEQEFRDDVRTFIGEQRSSNTWIREAMTAHEQRDAERFSDMQSQYDELKRKVGGHTQIIMRGKANWNLLYAVLGSLITILGVIATIWTFAKGG